MFKQDVQLTLLLVVLRGLAQRPTGPPPPFYWREISELFFNMKNHLTKSFLLFFASVFFLFIYYFFINISQLGKTCSVLEFTVHYPDRS